MLDPTGTREAVQSSYLTPTTLLLFTGNILGYLDRAAFSIAAPLIAADLMLKPDSMGYLLSAFSIGYVIVSFVGGAASDRFGAGPVITVAAILWSIACAMTALPVDFTTLLLIRIIFGAGEAPYTPTTNKIMAATTPPSRYSASLALVSAGQPIGGLLAGPVIGGIALAHGWRNAFLAVGIAGLLWAGLWAINARRQSNPVFHPLPAATARRESMLGQLRSLMRMPAVLAIAFAYFGFGYVLYFFLSWFPSYLVSSLGVSIKQMSLWTTAPWGLGLTGLISGGFLINRLLRWHWGAIEGRKHLAAGGLVIAALAIIGCGITKNVPIAVALMSLTIFSTYLTGVCYPGLVRELARPEQLGAMSGFIVVGFSLAGIVGPAITGVIIRHFGSYMPAFLLAGTIAIAGAIAIECFVKRGDLLAPNGR